MDNKELIIKLTEIIASDLGLSPEEIRLGAHFQEDLNVDPFELANLAANIEDKLGIEFEKEDIRNIKTVEDLVHMVEDLI